MALVNPGTKIEFATCEPLNLECIASYVQQHDIEVRIIDELAGQNVRKEILRYKPDIVGITATTPLILDAYRIASMCRQMKIRTVIGGVHATILPEESQKYADIVVKGEGEIAMLEIIQQGIKHGIIQGTPIKRLDDIPMYDKSGIEMDFYTRLPETYLACIPSGMRAIDIITSRGCPYSCKFCHNSWKDLPYRANSPERVINEIKSLVDKYNVGGVYFFDDNLFINKPRLHQICMKLIESNLSVIWAGCSRVDNLDDNTLILAKMAGCRQINFGFESGSQRMLDYLNKKTTVQQNAKAIQMCHDNGILATGTFIIGSPTETIEDVRLTQQFIKENPIDVASVWIMIPFPGTQIWDWCREHELVPEHPDWAQFLMAQAGSVISCDTIPYQELAKLYSETKALLSQTHNKVSIKWFIKMGLQHPQKSITIALRSKESFSKYLYRVFKK